MTLMSWLVVFLFALKDGGNWILGVIALIGIIFAHLATNLFDDYIDFKKLSTDIKSFELAPESKCAYIRDGSASLRELLAVVFIYLTISFVCGVILTYYCGFMIPLLAIIGGIIVLFYAKLSTVGLSELAVGIAFGPLLFEGVYYVMCAQFSLVVFLLSVSVVVFTVILLYVHTVLDFDCDVSFHKKTLCCRIGEKFKALKFLAFLMILGYISIIPVVFLTRNYYYLITYLTIPYSIQLYGAIYSYNVDKSSLPQTCFLNFPLENISTPAFHHRLFLARNLMVYFSLLIAIAIVL